MFAEDMDEINWCQVGRGIAVSMGQVDAINDVAASSLMNFAVFLASPLLFFTSTIGAVVGSLAGKTCIEMQIGTLHKALAFTYLNHLYNFVKTLSH